MRPVARVTRVRRPAGAAAEDIGIGKGGWDAALPDPLLDLDQTPAFDPTDPNPIPDRPPITAHPASTPTATSTSLRFDFDQTHGA